MAVKKTDVVELLLASTSAALGVKDGRPPWCIIATCSYVVGLLT
jgi:hypothetical protein